MFVKEIARNSVTVLAVMNLHVQQKMISRDQLGAYQPLKKISACWTSLSQIAV
jgi:hypothetical protein